jgi:hypothetical protein
VTRRLRDIEQASRRTSSVEDAFITSPPLTPPTTHLTITTTATMAFEWLAPILTPTALRSVQADPYPLLILLLVIIGLTLQGVLCWYIHFVTEKAYPRKKAEKKGNFITRLPIIGPFLTGVRR